MAFFTPTLKGREPTLCVGSVSITKLLEFNTNTNYDTPVSVFKQIYT